MKPEDFKIIGLECDVSSERSVQKAYEKVMDTFGRIDSVVASAGMATTHQTWFHLPSFVARYHRELLRL
jgi:NAD(P)-dependent dehydrogenase (short-subunit alcohol dehydrogenase family)